MNTLSKDKRPSDGRKGLQEEEEEEDVEVGAPRVAKTLPAKYANRRANDELPQREETAGPCVVDADDASLRSPSNQSAEELLDAAVSRITSAEALSPLPATLNIQVNDSSVAPSSGWDNNAEYTIADDNDTMVSDITDTHVVEAFTRAEMAERLRQQYRSEIQSMHANAITAQVIEPDPPSFWTKRRVIVSISVLLIAIIGIVVGVVVAIGGTSPPEEDYLDNVTIYGTDSEDRFGESVVISKDASTLAVAAEEGHYIQMFRRNGNETWTQIGQTLDNYTYQKDSKFEGHLDLNADGSILALGQWTNDVVGTNAGFAVVYWYNGTQWTQIGQPVFGSAAKDQFGYAVALSDDGRTIAVGSRLGRSSSGLEDAGYVRVYSFSGAFGQSNGEWMLLGATLESQTPRDHFGMSLALSEDGRRVAVGAQGGDAKKGIVRVYDYSNDDGDWTQIGQALEGDYDKDDADEVTMSADGSMLVIAANGDESNRNFEGYRRTYKIVGSTWIQLGEDFIGRPKRISLSSDGSCLAIGDPGHQSDQGRGEVFRWSDVDSRWNQIAVTKGDKLADRLGGSVTVSGNCSLFALGATRGNSPGNPSGYVRIYQVP